MNTAGRRQRQARNGYTHLPKQRRPRYSKISPSKSAARERKRLEKQKAMAARKGGK